MEEWELAIKLEIEAARRQATTYELQDGTFEVNLPDGYLYRFPFEYEIALPDDTEGDLQVGGRVIPCRVVSLVSNHLLLSSEQFLGSLVPEATITLKPWQVLLALREILHRQGGTPVLRKPAFASGPPALGVVARGFNPSQAAAAQAVVDSPACAVWGPPGTGKTRTASLAVATLLQKERRVLCLAPTNTAVDQLAKEIGQRLKDEPKLLQKVLRYGFPVQEQIREHPYISSKAHIACRNPRLATAINEAEKGLHEALKRGDRDAIKRWASEVGRLRKQGREELRRYLPQVMVLLTTVAMSLTDKDVREAGPFDLLLVDEASMVGQLFLIASQSLAHRLALFGDFRQLPPVTASEEGVVRKWLGKTGFDMWDIPQTVRKGIIPPYLKMLDIQYRMNPDIREKVSRFAYLGKLKDAPGLAVQRREEAARPPFPEQALVRLNTSPYGAEGCRPEGGSRWNIVSAALAVGLAQEALSQSFSPVAIITPYREQARLLHRLIRDLGLREVLCGTVHRFQGGEAPYVVVDLVEGKRRRHKWTPFFADDREETASRLFTVALSRAQVKVAILGDWPLLTSCLPPEAPLQRLWRGEPGKWQTAPRNVVERKPHAIRWEAETSLLPAGLLEAVKQAERYVLVHWSQGEVPQELRESLLDYFRDVSHGTGLIQASPPNLKLGIPGQKPVPPPPYGLELPGAPLVVVDGHTWWHRCNNGLWLGLVRVPRTVQLLVKLCGWPAIHKATGAKWLICVNCKQESAVIDMEKRQPILKCANCGRNRRASTSDVAHWLRLMGKICPRCSSGLDAKNTSSGNWIVVCSNSTCKWKDWLREEWIS